MNRRSRDFDTNQRNLFNAGDSRGIRLGTAGTSLLCLLFLLAACVEPYRPLDGAATLEPLTVEETAPAPDAVDVSVDTEISLTLSRSADPASVTPDSLVLMGPRGRVDVEITVDDVELFMRPNAPLIEGAVHKVIARKSIKDTFGIGLSPDGLQAETDYSFSFVTLATPPFVTAVSPPDGEQDVVASPPTPVLVTFSEPLDQASVGPRCVGVFDGHDLVSAGVECDDDECSSVKVEPMAPWREGRVHEVRVSRRCTDLSGITPAEVFTSTFSTGRVLPEVVSTVPEQGAVGVPVKGLVATFQASKALDASTIEEWNVAVSPPAPFRVAYDEEAMKIEVRLDSVLISNVSYTLTILDEVADIFGNRLGEPFTLTFVTAADPDNNPPGPISDLSHEISDRRTLSLSWTAPGGDTENGVGKGEAARYEIRRSKEPIFDWDAFEAAEPVPEEAPEPSTAGEREQLDLAPGLNVAWHYVVAAFDSAGNSRMSGSVLAAITLHEERWSPDDAFASAGRSLSLTDLFGDGNFALLVGVPGHDRVYVFPGTPSGPDLSVEPAVIFGPHGSGFGSSIAAGTIERSGRKGIVVGAPLENEERGAAYLIVVEGETVPSGEAALLAESVLRGDVVLDRVGTAVAIASLGEPSIDEAPTVIVGAPGDGLVNEGAIWTATAAPDGRPDLETASVRRGDEPGDRFGAALLAGEDVTGDGIPNIVVGAPGASPEGLTLAGRVQVLDLALPEPVLTLNGAVAGGLFGAAVAWGDTDDDGSVDLLVGAPFTAVPMEEDLAWSGAGAAFLFLGPLADSPTPAHTWTGNAEEANLGSALAVTAPMLPDMLGGLAIGAPGGVGEKGVRSGTVHLIHLAQEGEVIEDGVLEGTGHGDGYGSAIESLDLDGDGLADIVVGAPTTEAGGRDRGRVHLLR